jgi:hypothetical protein
MFWESHGVYRVALRKTQPEIEKTKEEGESDKPLLHENSLTHVRQAKL